MNPNVPNERLERLISRFLDDEATPVERAELNATVDGDPASRALYEDTAALDREVGLAMRRAVGRSLTLRPLARQHGGWTRLIGVAAAAALATILVFRGQAVPSGADRAGQPLSRVGNWGFVPGEQPGDVYESDVPDYALPHVQLRDTQRDWLVMPAEQPGQFLVIEVQRVQTRAVGIHNDY